MNSFLSLSLVLVLYCAQGYAINATAVFGTHGVIGWIRFTQSAAGLDITANLAGLDSTRNASWSIRQFPVLNTLEPSLRGTDNYVGDVLDFQRESNNSVCSPTSQSDCQVGDLSGRFGDIPSDFGTRLDTDTTGDITISGPNSIIGRSVVVMNGNTPVPATIALTDEENIPPPTTNIYTATFFSPVAGTIYFRQVAGGETTVFGKLYHVRGSATTSAHTWSIQEFEPPEGYQAGLGCTTMTIGGRYDPTNVNPPGLTAAQYAQQCTTATPTMCELGDLAGKFGTLTVEASPTPFSTSAFFFTDQNLTLSGNFNILGRSVAIFDSGDPTTVRACAPIVESETLYASQFDDFFLTVEQNSPYENSSLTISPNYPDSNPRVSILPDAFMTNGICTVDPSRIYNPFGVIPTAPRGLTPDLFPLGDIPNKYNLQFFGPNFLELRELPLYGPNTLTGKTIKITKQVGSDTITSCSTLVPPKEESGVLLKATFNTDPIRGGVYMIQNLRRDGSPYTGVTTVVVDLYYASTSATVTENHNWMITSVSCAALSSGTAPIVFNPFEVANTECSSLNQLRCANGDMSGKHSQLTLSPLSPTRETYSFIDSNIQLSRNYSVNGLSLVVMGPGSASNILACSTISKLSLSQPDNDIYFSTKASMEFDRVQFLNNVTSVAPLNMVLDPSNILLLNQVIGAQTADGSDTPCATFEMVVMAPSTGVANMYARITQRSLCERFLADPCFSQFREVCEEVAVTGVTAAPTEAGAPALKSTSAILLGALLAVLLALSM